MIRFDLPAALSALPSKAIALWVVKNPGKIVDVEYGSGYTTESGRAYNVLLASNWSVCGDAVHIIIEQTAADTIRALNNIERCYCGTCDNHG